MSGIGGPDAAREIARGLSQIVGQALDEGAPVPTLGAARDLARLVSLRGLDRLLGALSPYAGAEWPAALKSVIEQVRWAAAECGREGNVAALRRVDDELARIAQAIERTPLTPASVTSATAAGNRGERAASEGAPVRLAAALDGLSVQRGSDALLEKVRLHPPVAGALRAALDWLLGEGGALRLWLASDGSALEVTCDGVMFSGVHPAAEVLGTVGAHLGPAGDRPGAWTLRVPILSERETFLMLEQDELQLAVPWHAVARVRLMPTDTIDAMARRQGLQVLPPLAVAPRRAAEQPVVVVALGLKRACLTADRLVWRMSAQSAEAPGAPPNPGIVRAVRSDDGDLYWVLDPAWLLRDIPAAVVGDGGRRVPPATTATSVPTPTPPERDVPSGPPPPIPFPITVARGRTDQAGREPMRSLAADDVEPLDAAPANLDPSDATSVAEPDPAAPHESSSMPNESQPPVETTSPAESAPPETAESAPRAGSVPPAEAMPPARSMPPAPVESFKSAEPHGPAAPPARPSRQVLLAEDSITARIFLVRLLQQRGFTVHAVGTAAELRTLLPQGPWAMVCADLELPDARGEALLSEAMRGAGATRSPVVALVRDAADETVARAVGVAATLRKPFEPEALERLLALLVPDLPGGAKRAPGPAASPRDQGAR